MFKIIWSFKIEMAKMHLFRWEILDCSKELGVWALKNIFHFSKALLTKIQWLSFFRNSLWNNVLKIKYLKKL